MTTRIRVERRPDGVRASRWPAACSGRSGWPTARTVRGSDWSPPRRCCSAATRSTWRSSSARGATLDLFDVAGTVAYHGRGRPASWRTTLSLADGACLTYAGSAVRRLRRGRRHPRPAARPRRLGPAAAAGDPGARSRRPGRRPGAQPDRPAVGGVEAWREDTDLDPAGIRDLPGLLGGRRVVDTVLTVGQPAAAAPPAVAYALLGGVGTVTRYLGTELADSPLS